MDSNGENLVESGKEINIMVTQTTHHAPSTAAASSHKRKAAVANVDAEGSQPSSDVVAPKRLSSKEVKTAGQSASQQSSSAELAQPVTKRRSSMNVEAEGQAATKKSARQPKQMDTKAGEADVQQILEAISRIAHMKRKDTKINIDDVVPTVIHSNLEMEVKDLMEEIPREWKDDKLKLKGFTSKGKVYISDGNARLKAMRELNESYESKGHERPYPTVLVGLHPESVETSAFDALFRAGKAHRFKPVQKTLHVSMFVRAYKIKRTFTRKEIESLLYKMLPKEDYGWRVVYAGMRLTGEVKSAFEELTEDAFFNLSGMFDAYNKVLNAYADGAERLVIEYARTVRNEAMNSPTRKEHAELLKAKLNSLELPLGVALKQLPRGFKNYTSSERKMIKEEIGKYKNVSSTVNALLNHYRHTPKAAVLVEKVKAKLHPPQNAAVQRVHNIRDSKATVVFVNCEELKDTKLAHRILRCSMSTRLIILIDVNGVPAPLSGYTVKLTFIGPRCCVAECGLTGRCQIVHAMVFDIGGKLLKTKEGYAWLKERDFPVEFLVQDLDECMKSLTYLFIGNSHNMLGIAKHFDCKKYTLQYDPAYDPEEKLKALIERQQEDPSLRFLAISKGTMESEEAQRPEPEGGDEDGDEPIVQPPQGGEVEQTANEELKGRDEERGEDEEEEQEEEEEEDEEEESEEEQVYTMPTEEEEDSDGEQYLESTSSGDKD